MLRCQRIFLPLLLLLFLGSAPTHSAEEPLKKHAYTGILSVKPVEKASELDRLTLRVRGLIPGTGFLINKDTILTARHVQGQSPLALVYTLDETGQRAKRYTAYGGEPFAELGGEYPLTTVSRKDGHTIKINTMKYDVARYITQERITDTTALTPYDGTVKSGLEVSITGVVFIFGHYTTRHATGHIQEIHRAANGAHILFLDIESERGMSGSPVTLLPSGKVIGVLMGEYRYASHRNTVAWSLPKSIAPDLNYQPTEYLNDVEGGVERP